MPASPWPQTGGVQGSFSRVSPQHSRLPGPEGHENPLRPVALPIGPAQEARSAGGA